jgi:hypothetical protein
MGPNYLLIMEDSSCTLILIWLFFPFWLFYLCLSSSEFVSFFSHVYRMIEISWKIEEWAGFMYRYAGYCDVLCHFNCCYVASMLFCTARIDSSETDPSTFIFTTFSPSVASGCEHVLQMRSNLIIVTWKQQNHAGDKFHRDWIYLKWIRAGMVSYLLDRKAIWFFILIKIVNQSAYGPGCYRSALLCAVFSYVGTCPMLNPIN